MHWLDMLKVRDLMHAEVALRQWEPGCDGPASRVDAPRAPVDVAHPMPIARDDSLRRACVLMSEHGVGRLVVLDGTRPVGSLSAVDVVRYLASGGGL